MYEHVNTNESKEIKMMKTEKKTNWVIDIKRQ